MKGLTMMIVVSLLSVASLWSDPGLQVSAIITVPAYDSLPNWLTPITLQVISH